MTEKMKEKRVSPTRTRNGVEWERVECEWITFGFACEKEKSASVKETYST